MPSKALIVIDTREQVPYTFDPGRIETVRRALPAGDYSLQGLESRVAVERKSLEDFVGTLTRSRERFKKELLKLQGYEFACVVVECSLTDVLSGKYRSDVHPNALLGSAISIIADYHVPVFFCTNRQAACLFVQTLLLRLHMKEDSRCQKPQPKYPPS
ncbi:MAG: ERCC4 domain-containing protein [Armatimonadota bacterium]